MKMTPKEKAKELVDKFARIDGYQDSIDLSKCDYEKQCALIAVDEILNSRKKHLVQSIKFYEYWTEVKRELERL